MRTFLLLSTLAATALPATGRAAESYDNCTGYVDSVPAVIGTQGTWCLRQDVSMALTAGTAILIETNNVTLDCNHFKVGGLAAGADTLARGVSVPSRLNATIRNCNIRGFYYGIQTSGTGSGGHLVEHNRLDGNTSRGIVLGSEGSTIRDNLIVDTGGTSVVGSLVAGVYVNGEGNDVLDNTIAGLVPDEAGVTTYGVFFATTGDGTVARNRIRGLNPVNGEQVYGIQVVNGGHAILHDNILQGPPNNDTSTGIRCSSNAATARANVIAKFNVGVDTCVSSGNIINAN